MCIRDRIQVQGSSGKVETIDNYNTYALLDSRYNADLADATYNQVVSGGHDPALTYNPKGARMAVLVVLEVFQIIPYVQLNSKLVS